MLAERVTVDGRAHGELLAPELHAALAEVGLAPRDLDAIVVGRRAGPVHRSAGRAGHRRGDRRRAGHPGLRRVHAGRHRLAVADHGKVLVATDARRREVYWGFYDDGVRVDGPSVCKPADLVLPDDVAGRRRRRCARSTATCSGFRSYPLRSTHRRPIWPPSPLAGSWIVRRPSR